VGTIIGMAEIIEAARQVGLPIQVIEEINASNVHQNKAFGLVLASVLITKNFI